MKKIFWTSIVRIVLFGFFLLYMKWFNQPLAKWMTEFLVKWEENIVEEIVEWQLDLSGSIIVEEVENVEVSKVIPSESTTDTNWIELFEKLDRIELLINKNDNWSNNIQTGETDEEVFDQFKTWYEENKK